jgi:hypothetical protein
MLGVFLGQIGTEGRVCSGHTQDAGTEALITIAGCADRTLPYTGVECSQGSLWKSLWVNAVMRGSFYGWLG